MSDCQQVTIPSIAPVVELHDSEEILDGTARLRIQEARVVVTPGSRLHFELKLDREGNASVDGERIGLDELRAEFAKLKRETSSLFRVRINAASEVIGPHKS